MKSEEEIREAYELFRDYIDLIKDVPVLQIAVGHKSHTAMVGTFACLGWLLDEPPYLPCPVAGTIEVARQDLKNAEELRANSAALMASLDEIQADTITTVLAPPKPSKTIH